MNLIHKLRWHFSEFYRIRKGNGVFPIRNKREAKALYAFCVNQLRNEMDEEEQKLNKPRCMAFMLYMECWASTFKRNLTTEESVEEVAKLYNEAANDNVTIIEASNVYYLARHLAGWFWS